MIVTPDKSNAIESYNSIDPRGFQTINKALSAILPKQCCPSSSRNGEGSAYLNPLDYNARVLFSISIESMEN